MAFCYLLILLPIHRAESPPIRIWTALPAVTLFALLVLFARVLHGVTLSACAQVFGGVFEDAAFAHASGIRADAAGSTDWRVWPAAAASLVFLLVIPLVVVRGLSVRAAFAAVGRGLRRRPWFGVGSVLLLVVAAQCVLVPIVFFQLLNRTRSPDEGLLWFSLLGGICTGVLGGFWVWLQARAALALADAGTEASPGA
jgi:hypothetical protein